MIYGIGTDICDVRRIRASLERHGERFAEKVLADGELASGASAARAGPSAACATWPRAFLPRRPSARPSAWACACP
jgi:phosphopantetheinyl transferase (holo-ACP synthase)